MNDAVNTSNNNSYFVQLSTYASQIDAVTGQPVPTHPLSQLRAKIDAIDDKLFALLKQRIGIVKQVGELKSRDRSNRCFIRSGREAGLSAARVRAIQGYGFFIVGSRRHVAADHHGIS